MCKTRSFTAPRRNAAALLTSLSIGAFVSLTLGTSAPAQDASPQTIGKTLAESQEGTAPTAQDTKGLPNVLWILLDDAGFGASSAFGGEIETPVFDRLANE